MWITATRGEPDAYGSARESRTHNAYSHQMHATVTITARHNSRQILYTYAHR